MSDVFDHTPEELAEMDMVSGADLLDEVEAMIRKYTIQPSEHAYVALVCYVAYTHAAAAFDFAPRLVLTSAEKRSGKSRTMEVAKCMSANPLVSANATVAAIFRSLGEDNIVTLCFDEADTIFGTKVKAEQNEDLRGLLNAGFQRGMPVLRTVPPKHDVQAFQTFAPAIIAAIGSLPDTVTDRAVNIRLRRRKTSEQVAPFRMRKDQPHLLNLGYRLGAWVKNHLDALEEAEPETPLEDRAADVWEPLFAVADLAGRDWPMRVRTAAIALTAEAAEVDEERSEGLELLADIRDVLDLVTSPFVGSSTLVELLKSKQESRWMESGLTARRLSDLLKPYRIKPKGKGKVRGYDLDPFRDAFDRYLPTTRLEPSKPSKTASDQQERIDTSEPIDTLNRQPETNRQTVSPGQTQDLTLLTVPDTSVPEVGDDPQCIKCGRPVKAQYVETYGEQVHPGCKEVG